MLSRVSVPSEPSDPPQPTASTRSTTILGLAAVVNLFLALNADEASSIEIMLGSAMFWVSVLPSWLYFTGRDRGPVPFMPAMCIFYFFAYGLPSFRGNLRVRFVRIEAEYAEAALIWALIGEVAMLAAFYGAGFRLRRSGLERRRRLQLPADLEGAAGRMLLLCFVLSGVRFVLMRAEVPQVAAQLALFIHDMPQLLLAGLFIVYLRGTLPAWMAAAALFLFSMLLIDDFTTGLIAKPMLAICSVLFAYMLERRRAPIVAGLVIALLVIIPALGAKQRYRELTWTRDDLSQIERMEIFAGLLADVYTGDATTRSDAGDRAESRADHLSALAYVMSMTPQRVPYWGGETYIGFFWSFVPRFLYPDKPLKVLGQEYGHRYSILDSHDTTTSINLEQTVEMYANFGYLGILFGMTLLGLIYRMIYSFINHPDAGDGGALIAISVFLTLMNIESDFSIVFGGVLINIFLLYFVLRRLIGLRRADEPFTARLASD